MDDASLSADVIREITDLHEAFQTWFRGEGPAHLERVERALSPKFTIIPPNGAVVDRSQLLESLLASRGSRPVDITVEESKLIWHSDDAAVATYVEIQTHAGETTRRRSTALFSYSDLAPNGILWQHVHETWIQPSE